jgi:chemotaxis signal transduction protein
MSVGRFKSKDDYFSRKSGFAERIIQAKPQKFRKKAIESTIPITLLRVHFCKTVESFEIEGEGRFRMGEYSLDDALSRHLSGEANVLVDPLSHSGETAFSLVKFDLSPEMDLPFSKARQYADELLKQGISSQIEVTGGGKGHYHVLIFHEEPIPGRPFSEALVRFGYDLFGIYLDTVPAITGNAYVPLPLQGEDMLLQRRVFVNAVGKMVKDQAQVLRTIEPCPKKNSESFIRKILKPVQDETNHAKLVSAPTFEPKLATPRPPLNEPPTVKEKPEAKLPEPAPARPIKPSPIPIAASGKEETVSAPAGTGKMATILSFMRSGKEFAVETHTVQEIIPAGEITPIPGMPPLFSGVKILGQRIIPVLDVGMLYTPHVLSTGGDPAGRTSPSNLSRSRIILLNGGDEAPGILADSMSGQEEVDEGLIESAGQSEYIRGKVMIRSERASYERGPQLENGKRELLLLNVKKLQKEAATKKKAPLSEKGGDNGDLYVLFSRCDILFGLAAQAVVEFLPPSGIVKGAPGCISFRGKLLQMADLPAPAGSSTSSESSDRALRIVKYTGRERIMVVENRSSTFCVKADNITGIRNIPSFMIEPIPGKSGIPLSPVAGAARLSGEERFVVILDPDAFFSPNNS